MKFTTKSVHEVDYKDLDKAINLFLGSKGCPNNFRYVAADGASNDTSASVTIEPEKPDKLNMKAIKCGQYLMLTCPIMSWMCLEKVIPAGDYLIQICW